MWADKFPSDAVLHHEICDRKKEFLELYKDNQKEPFAKGTYQYSSSQGQYADMLVEIIPLDSAFAKTQLAKVVEPRFRLRLLVELAAYYAKKTTR